MAVFGVVASCRLVWVYRRFKKFQVRCLLIVLMTEATNTSETSINFNQTARCYNPQDSHLLSQNYSLIVQMQVRTLVFCQRNPTFRRKLVSFTFMHYIKGPPKNRLSPTSLHDDRVQRTIAHFHHYENLKYHTAAKSTVEDLARIMFLTRRWYETF
jgi:hypothetical protein